MVGLGTKLAALAALLALGIATPGAALPTLSGAGVVTDGTLFGCGRGGPQTHLDFDFAGTIPHGGKTRLVSGHATGNWVCDGLSNPPAPTTLTASTLQGRRTFTWQCSGPLSNMIAGVELTQLEDMFGIPIRTGPTFFYNPTCSDGAGGTFKMRVYLHALSGDSNPSPYDGHFSPLVGAYLALIPSSAG